MKKVLNQFKDFTPTVFCGLTLIAATLSNRYIPAISPYIYIAAFLIGGIIPAMKGIQDTVENRQLNVEILMILAAIGATLIGHWAEGATLIFIFSLSGALEDYATDKNKKEIQKLMDFQPEIARKVLPDGTLLEVPVDTLHIGDVVAVLKGDAVPIDGAIIEGTSSFAESAITGEPLPKEKTVGDAVFGATINEAAPIKLIVQSEAKDTLVRKIVTMVEESQNTPSKTAAFIDKLENTYVNIVLIVVAFMLFLPHYLFGWPWSETFYRAMVLLVVASPCALVASVSPATLSAISNAAKNGILVKGGAYLEKLEHIQAVAFDKTGTLTYGKPQIITTYFLPNEDSVENAAAIAALESFSAHPLAITITEHFSNNMASITSQELLHVNDIAGFGVTGTVNGAFWRIGKKELMETTISNDVSQQAEQAAKNGQTLVYYQKNNTVIGFSGLQDVIREEVPALINHLKGAGITPIMITGDNEFTASHIAADIGIDRFIANTLPDEKAHIIEELRAEFSPIAMVGDGINDAPALAHSDCGIAMGQGTDIAIEAADVVLMHNDLSKVFYAVELSKSLKKVTRFNIFFSLSVIALLILSNFFQFLTLPLGVIGHEGSTILVILNGMRLLTFRLNQQHSTPVESASFAKF